MIDISNQMLEDSAFDMEGEIRGEATEQFAVKEGAEIRGPVWAGQKSCSVYETTGIGARDPRGRQRAEKIKEQREPEILRELLTAPSERVTWAEAAADYGANRTQERVARNPALAGRPDKELEHGEKSSIQSKTSTRHGTAYRSLRGTRCSACQSSICRI
ncbi:MAG: phage major capsid protein [Dongiaceae bacterium]